MMSSQDAQFGGDTGIDADYKYEYAPWVDEDTIPRCPYSYENEKCSCPKFQATAGDIDEPFSYCDFVVIENSKGWCEIGIIPKERKVKDD